MPTAGQLLAVGGGGLWHGLGIGVASVMTSPRTGCEVVERAVQDRERALNLVAGQGGQAARPPRDASGRPGQTH